MNEQSAIRHSPFAIRILLVEDEEAHAGLVRRAFEAHADRFRLAVAGSLREARACLAQESQPDLLITDLRLPDGRGIELLPAEDKAERDRFPVVVMTAHGDEQVAVEAMKAGALDYVVKSEATLAGMPRIAERAVREWEHITARVRAEEVLRESEEKYRNLVETITEQVWEVDAKGVYTYSSAGTRDIYGLEPEEVVGKTALELMPPEESERLAGAYAKIVESREAFSGFESIARHKDGRQIVMEVSGAPFFAPDGTLLGYRGAARDITERKRVQERVEHLNAVLRAIRDVNQLITKEKDRDGLLSGACDSLVGTRGYHSAWIALLDEAGGLVMTAEAGLGEEFLSMVEQLKRGELTACGRRALRQSEVVVTEAPASTCTDCPLAKEYGGRGAMTVRLEYDGKVYGLLSASIPAHLAAEEEERSLLQEVVGDIAFALHNIELEEEHKWAQREVEERRMYLEAVMGAAPDAIVTLDARYRIVEWNSGAERLFGYSREEVIGRNIDPLITNPDTFEEAVGLTQTVVGGDDVLPRETVRYRKDGSPVDVLLAGSPILVGGEFIGVVAVYTDITERKRAEEALRESEEHYRAVVESQTEFIGRWRPDGTLTFVNDAYCRYYGKPREEFIGHKWMMHAAEEDQERVQAYIEHLMTSLSPANPTVTDEHREVAAEGTMRWQQWADQAFFDEQGHLVEFQSVGRDITERKRAEEALAEERNLLRTLINNLPDYIYVKDVEGQFVMANMAVARQMGFSSPDEVIGKSDFDLFPHELAARYHAAEQEIIRSGQGLRDHEGPYIDASKEEENRWVSTTKVPLRDAQGEIAGFVGLGRDITERKQAEQALQRRNQELAALNAVAQALSSSLELRDILDKALSRTAHALKFTGGLISLADERTGGLVLSGHVGLLPSFVEHLETHGLGGTPCDFIYREGKPLGLDDLREGGPVGVCGLLDVGVQSYVGAPIVHKDRILGSFCLFGTAPRPLSETDYALLTAIGRQIGVAVENARLYEETQRRASQAALAYEVGRRVSSKLELSALLSAIVTAIYDAFDYHGVMLMLLDEEAERLTLQSIAGGYADIFLDDFWLAIGEGMIGYAAATGETQVSGDVGKDPHYVRKAEEVTESELAVPIKSGQEVIGVLDVQSDSLDAFDEMDVMAMETLADQIAVAIENARLFGETCRRVRELRLLHDVGLAAASGVRLEETLQAAAVALAAELQGNNVALLLLDSESGALRMEASVGYSPDVVKDLRIRLGEGITGWVAQHGEPALVPDVRLDPRYYEGDPDIRSELCIPLAAGPLVVGVLNVESPQVNAFTDDDQRLLSTLASNLTVLIERARLFEEMEAARMALQQRAEALEEANVRLRELDRLKSEFLANMSHELRTPLNSVIGFSEVLIDGLVGEVSSEQKECLGNIRSSGKDLLALINDILDLSKIEAGRVELKMATFDVAGLLAEVQVTIRPLIEKKSQVLKIEQAGGLPSLTADRFRIKQALLNLLSNAHKFTLVEGCITLSCRLVDQATMLFSVTDTGIGIKPEDQRIIFDEFRQVDGSASREITGTGLGLAISKRLVEMHGGRIWVESEYGHGATFSLLLPLAGPSAAREEASAYA